MLKVMLEGVNDLMTEALGAKTMRARETFIVCAQAVLEKCIESLQNNEVLTIAYADEPIPQVQPSIPTPKKTSNKVAPVYEIRVDNKKLVQIVDKNGEEAPGELRLEIDGQETNYAEAKGRPFSTGRFL